MPAPKLTGQQIDSLQALLEAKRSELEAQLATGEAAARPVELDQQSVGRVSRIDAIQQQQMAIANRQQALILIKRIESGLLRIVNNEYGYCLLCGEPIAFARLQVQPFASLCLECQSASEQR
ncbi:MAG: TraR/DksA family transcriptional regulator [Gammaproteobacteria bacterium]|nr:TraR/DksA family transcriptional regulator [Gammaproteobacteria bacterium]MDH3447280.1 TraR/DksA family transcriptional regulator [Gammaproteobacteria bacterium]